MKCPRCYKDNPMGAKFCGGCAGPLSLGVKCPQCGHLNPENQKYCNECAYLLIDELSSIEKRSLKESFVYYVIATLMLAFVAFWIAAIILWVPGTWNERLSAYLAIVGIYGLATGFLLRSVEFKTIRSDLEDMTSTNIVQYIGGNCYFISLLFSLLGDAMDSRKKTGYPLWHFLIGKPLLILSFLLLILYTIFHLFVVAILSFIPIVLTSIVVDELVYSGEETVIEYKSKSEHERFWIKGIITSNPVTSKLFLLGIPAFSISLLSAIISLFVN